MWSANLRTIVSRWFQYAPGHVRWLDRPRQCQLGRDHRRVVLLEELDESGQLATLALELVAERPAELQVLGDCLGERAHDSLPGHGSASCDRAMRSTLAYSAVVSMLWWRSSWPISGSGAPRRSNSLAIV